TQAVVVDLRTRTIRGILHYPQGWPGFVFSLDGRRVYAAGMSNASVVTGWRLPEDDTPRTPRWWTLGVTSRSGGSSLLVDGVSGRFEFYRPEGQTLVASGVHTISGVPRLVGDQSRVAYISPDARAVIYDLATDRVVSEEPCRGCSDIAVSDDGS